MISRIGTNYLIIRYSSFVTGDKLQNANKLMHPRSEREAKAV